MHHIAIARNIPLDEIVTLLTTMAPQGVIGFVPPTDRRAQALFRGREEIFRNFTLDNFLALLQQRARIVKQQPVPGTERILIWFPTERAG